MPTEEGNQPVKTITFTGPTVDAAVASAINFFNKAAQAAEEVAFLAQGGAKLTVVALKVLESPEVQTALRQLIIQKSRTAQSERDRGRIAGQAGSKGKDGKNPPRTSTPTQTQVKVEVRRQEMASTAEGLKEGTTKVVSSPVQQKSNHGAPLTHSLGDKLKEANSSSPSSEPTAS
jgi:hypothetical protein